MDPSRESKDAARAVGSLSLSDPMVPPISHPYDPQMTTASYSGPVIGSPYHVQHPHALYYPHTWPAALMAAPADGQAITAPDHSPLSSDEGDTRVDREHGGSSTGYQVSAQKTLFLAGFPPDVKEREIFNLLRFQPGFVDCSLTPSANGKQAVAFASWHDHESALRCRDLLQGLRFDPYVPNGTILRVQFARTESKSRRLPLDPSAPASSVASLALRNSPSSATPTTFSPRTISRASGGGGSASSSSFADSGSSSDRSSGSTHSHPTSRSPHVKSQAHTSRGRSSPTQQKRLPVRRPTASSSTAASAFPISSPHASSSFVADPKAIAPPIAASMTSPSERVLASPAPSSSSPGTTASSPSVTTQHNLPQRCSTLFITNLSMLSSEPDLLALFSPCPGFHRLRFQLNTEGAPIAFADFESEDLSSRARSQLQGVLLHHTPLRIEFAKQKMKRTRKR